MKKSSHRKDAKHAKVFYYFVINMFLRVLCLFAVKMVFRSEHQHQGNP
jgi:hypothetical protein